MKSEFTVCYNDGTHLGDVNYIVFYVEKLMRVYDTGNDVMYGDDATDTITVTQLRYNQVFNSIDVIANKFWEILKKWVHVRLRELVKYERFITEDGRWRSVIIKVSVEVGESFDEGHRITLSLGKESFSMIVTPKVNEEIFLSRELVITMH